MIVPEIKKVSPSAFPSEAGDRLTENKIDDNTRTNTRIKSICLFITPPFSLVVSE
jgi:hypothetical protein